MTLETAGHTADVGAVMTIVAVFMDVLPHISAIVTLLWLLIRVYETQTVQNALQKHKATKRRNKHKKEPLIEDIDE
jgi:uncharacterized membrane protein